MSSPRHCLAITALLATELAAQVHYHPDGRPWNERARSGPDAEVPGWFYNLGITGLRAQLVADEPKTLLVKHVFAKTPAHGRIEVGDVLLGAGGRPFEHEHRNGYGMQVFGARGPIREFADALEQSQAAAGKGRLALTVRRGGAVREVELELGQRYGAFAATFPRDCSKTDRVLGELCRYLLDHQRDDGSFGNPVHDTFAPLALLASGDEHHLPAVERNARWHARTTKAKDEDSLINWRYMAAAIVLAEYHLATKEEWVVPELQEVHDFLARSQYLDMAQINPKAKESHPHSFPKDAMDSHGGWGHNPGFEGYGPICMLTGQGALAYALMHRCGIPIDRARHDAAYAFLGRATGPNGYVWYEDEVGDPKGWADLGRTGAAGIACWLGPYPEARYRERALLHAKVIGQHPESFPDTHGSPLMGMAWAAVAAHVDPESFRRLMDENRWWFALAQCADGSFCYQPNRDNAGYGDDARLAATAVVAFVLSVDKRSLVITGR